ncbi:DUF1217 domain-containing protein, partial [Falsirhodobacter sp. alg1]|uniref:DUF1217 domain-containing protein n=1 Tax=Falsirhodobacter sp. alg1 TaxID=1472418 RepID=UPI0005ED7A21
ELGTLAASSSSDDTKWFKILGSESLRSVFQTAFGLPTSFASIDLDQQLTVMKAKAKSLFGSSSISDFANSDKVDALIKRFLIMSDLTNPSLDIALRNGDVISVERDRRTFMSLGATGQSVVHFEKPQLSALEAIAQVGGLQTNLADPKGVFVFRDEDESTVRSLTGRTDFAGPQRVAYVLDLTEPSGMFEARDFQIRDGDIYGYPPIHSVRW